MSSQNKEENLSLALNILASSLGTAISTVLEYPLRREKIIRQTQDIHPKIQSGEIKKYQGLTNTLIRITKEEGFSQLWRGSLPGIIRIIPTKALQIPIQNFYNKLLPNYNQQEINFKIIASSILKGSLTGATTLLIVYPIDFARTKLAADLGSGESRQFQGIVDCLTKTYDSSGIKGLYAGYLPSVLGIVSYRGVYYCLYSIFKDIGLGKLNTVGKFLTAQLIVSLTGLITYPIDIVVQRLRMQSGGQQLYNGVIDCFSKILKKEGFKAFFKGCGITLLQGIVSSLILIAYDETKKQMKKKQQ